VVARLVSLSLKAKHVSEDESPARLQRVRLSQRV
jgi:hypothetical protein